jgi:glycogen debranching enzyme
MEKENLSKLWTIGYDTILELETAEGILASGKEEIYGCIFGRDTLITSLKLLKVYEKTKNEYFLTLVKKVLQNLALLQGTKVNIESGEEPGKCIHEFRPTNHEHLTKNLLTPWYVYDDNIMRNYDTVDATPLFLVAMYEYYKVSGDEEFLQRNLGSVANGLHWIKTYGDSNGDGFIDYTFHKDRKFGGLHTQSWMDSSESVFHEDGTEAVYPVAPVEVQAYTYAALRAWSDFFPDEDLSTMAANLKKEFNQKFVLTPHDDSSDFEIAFAIDGNGKALSSARSSMGHRFTVMSYHNELRTAREILEHITITTRICFIKGCIGFIEHEERWRINLRHCKQKCNRGK